MGNKPYRILRKTVRQHDKEGKSTDDESNDADSDNWSAKRKQSRQHQTAALLKLFEKLELTADGSNAHPGELSRTTFENAFDGPLHKFGKLMYQEMVTTSVATNRERITREQFVKAGKEILKMYEEKQLVKFYFHLFASGKDNLSIEDARQMFEISFALTLSLSKILHETDERDEHLLKAMVTGLFGVHTEVNQQQFLTWHMESCPTLFHCVHKWVTQVMTGSSLPKEMMEMSTMPQLDSGNTRLSMATLWLLSVVLPQVYTKQELKKPPTGGGASASLDVSADPSSLSHSTATTSGATKDPMWTSMLLLRKMARLPQCQNWKLLYNSDDHGMSINRFASHVTSYNAPNLAFFSFEGKNLYCLASDCGWREGVNKFGGEDCRTIQLSPVYRVVQAGAKMIRWSECTRGIPQGIQIGCDGMSEVLRIPQEFDKILHYGVPCELYKIQVWGCGLEESLVAQRSQKQWEAGMVRREQGRKLKPFGETWEDSPDKQILQWGGVDVGNHSYSQ